MNKKLSSKKSREERLTERHRNTLRCEWCNRYVPVSPRKFKEVWPNRDTWTYECKQPRCITHRPEGWDEVPKHFKKLDK